MSTTNICLKWLGTDARQIELKLSDGGAPIVYPSEESRSQLQGRYEDEFCPVFRRVVEIFERLYGNKGIYSRYGIFKDDSSVLACLICWPVNEGDNSKGVSVERIPREARQSIAESIMHMAGYWKLSTGGRCTEAEFANYAVANYRWIFDFNVTPTVTSLSCINRDALELEWCWFNQDRSSFEKKCEQLAAQIGADNVNSYRKNIVTYGKHV
jgi:hypothetical protein